MDGGEGGTPRDTLRGSLDETLPGSPLVPDAARPTSEQDGSGPRGRDMLGTIAGARYELGSELGRGGMGVVVVAEDARLGRSVALKRHRARDDRATLRFTEEARATAQLEHPSIVPVYDLDLDEDGQPYFTMRLVEGLSLRQVLDGLRMRDAELEARFDLAELLLAFLKACDAVAYAHARRVLHRDLKPENVMLGRFGEVFVMDWGLARVGTNAILPPPLLDDDASTPSAPTSSAEREVSSLRDSEGALTLEGSILGTPGYMAPEQARGAHVEVDERADVFALGLILYEMLTLEPAIGGSTWPERLLTTLMGELVPPSLRAPEREVPAAFDAITMRALAKNPKERTVSVTTLRDEVARTLEGSREAARRRARAEERLALASSQREQHEELRARYAERLAEHERRVASTALDDAAGRRALWAAERELQALETSAQAAFWNAYGALASALAEDPSSRAARTRIVALLLDRAAELRVAGATAAARDLEAIARQHDADEAARRLDARGTLALEADPPGAVVRVSRFEAEGPLMLERVLGLELAAPAEVELAPGSYVADLESAGRAPVRVPFVVRPGERVARAVVLPEAHRLAPGFVVVPGGEYPVGGDTRAPGAEPARRVSVRTFGIARYLVTMAQYAELLNHLAASDPEQARARAPRVSGSVLFSPDASGRYVTPFVDPDGDRLGSSDPVLGISVGDGVAYAAFESERLGLSLRLPTSEEWEIAARGADDRAYPWGHGWDPSLCWNTASHGSARGVHPVGSKSFDRSLFGLYDMAGLVREVTSTKDERGLCAVRGGAWQGSEEQCRIGRVTWLPEDSAYATFSIRLAQDL